MIPWDLINLIIRIGAILLILYILFQKLYEVGP